MDKGTIEKILLRIGEQGTPADVHRIAEQAAEGFSKTLVPSRQHILWSDLLRSRVIRFAAAAVIAIIVVGRVSFWPRDRSENGKWWLGPPAAWGQEIIASLDKIEALVYRQQVLHVREFGPPQMSKGWERRYNAKDRYRRDRYDDGVNIANIQWVIPDGNDVLMVEVSLEYKCYFERKNERYGFVPDPVEKLRRQVRRIDRADRIVGTKELDGRECVGFEIGARRYGDNSPERFDHIWFDVQTKLPARIERHGIPNTYHAGETFTIIHDQFEYYREVPLELFEPQIPEGFINAHPDDVRAAREREEKGELVFADVPEGLKNQVIEALKEVETAVYREGSHYIYLCKNAWLKDLYSEDRLEKTEWFVIETDDSQESGFDSNDVKLTKTTVDFANKTWRIGNFERPHLPRHPMDRILFLAGFVDRADRCLGEQEIEGVECFGFEISAKKYGTNPDHMIHRLWFEKETKLPVRMEFQWLGDDGPRKKVKDRFQWNPVLPADTFVPEIPEGFTPMNPDDR